MSTRDSVVIIGTGDYGRGLGKRLLASGYDVTYGSRHPAKRNLVKIDESLLGARVLSIEDALEHSDTVFIAVNMEAYSSLMTYEQRLQGKVLIDVSNGPKKPKVASNAEALATQFPNSKVVKAFNTVSAYTLQSDTAGDSRQVFICGEDPEARNVVKTLARNMGFTAVDCGGLAYAKELETQPHRLLQGWGWPTIVTLVWLVTWTMYTIATFYWIKDSPSGLDFKWDRLPSTIMNKVTGCLSVTLLALCYLPGCLAAFLQLLYGTKYKRFAAWLDTWLKMRKQLGLYALVFGIIHCILSLALINEANFEYWFVSSHQIIPVNLTRPARIPVGSVMNLDGELVILLGVLALVVMAIVGVTSLPSVGAALNWREWTFVQSHMGWLCLLLAAAHATVKGGYYWNFMVTDKMYGAGWTGVVQTNSFISMLIPWLCIFMKILILLPCVNSHLWKIRRGYERGSSDDLEAPAAITKNNNEVYSPARTAPKFSSNGIANGTTHISNGSTHISNGSSKVSNGGSHVSNGIAADDLAATDMFHFQGGQENGSFVHETEKL